ncbi:nitroreductase [Sulfitobacter sp. D35]|uniref:nitroreductase n=1 Tax=Sulfitobacter sp. D35 TaxID=3083252 RepID=UPI00296F5D1C|nr:nitroreductase [Sulfitobacter sp. D35]MDW4499834.1 nitroreductase [Sulfitobacter sp. D35]
MTDTFETEQAENRIDALEDILAARYSCRAFRPDPVPRDTIERIVRTARRVPSWCNAQPWQVAVTATPQATDRFRDMLRDAVANNASKLDLEGPSGYSGAYAERRRTCGWALYDAVGVQKGDRAASGAQMMRNYDLFDAPHVAIVTSPRELAGYGAMDCGGFVTAFTLAATALGVDTIVQAAIAFYADAVRDHFKIAEDRMILCAISFGYAVEDHPANSFRTERAPLDEIIDWRN